ncbi:MAG: redoxin domain-containing protein [Planctomycetes bacterium]|nr:redoxin domain-containing protein [Planctomycetota bacterium]MCB9889280.1 redoxin domain-containing protein [Planctomycetota bacterium]
MITPGTPAPDFRLTDHFGRSVSLAQFRGTCNVLLLFYPLDWTPT